MIKTAEVQAEAQRNLFRDMLQKADEVNSISRNKEEIARAEHRELKTKISEEVKQKERLKAKLEKREQEFQLLAQEQRS